MSLRSTPHLSVYDVIGQNNPVEKDLPADEFLVKYQAWIDMYKPLLKPQDLLAYRARIREQAWANQT